MADLDEEFKRTIADMKPHARLLPQKSGKNDRTEWAEEASYIRAIISSREETPGDAVDQETPGKQGSEVRR